MDQSKFISRLFDGKPIDMFPKGVKAKWESGGTRREPDKNETRCADCGKPMAGIPGRTSTGRCYFCLERARLARIQAG